MNKKIILLISLILMVISFVIVLIFGREISYKFNMKNMRNLDITCDNTIVKCDSKIENNIMYVNVTPIKPGKGTIHFKSDILKNDGSGEYLNYDSDIYIYVHNFNIMTKGAYFGKCRGDMAFVISTYLIVIISLISLIIKYKKDSKKNMYAYKKARRLGLIFFITIVLGVQLLLFTIGIINGYNDSILGLLLSINMDTYAFLILVFPIAVILTLLVTIGNIILKKKEGRRWTNLLGLILGGFINIATVFIILFYSISGTDFFLSIISDSLAMFIAYLECVFFGVCIMGIKAARHVPEFNKDAIIILGCKIKEDGGLTPLLKSRVDRAIEFSKMQKEKTNKDIIFVPSGGKGNDEVISEAEAMKKYLLGQGIKNKNILVEDKSINTYQNMKFSNKLIKEKIDKPNIAFSTTNYHVYRAGIIANDQKIAVEGIGAKTRSYFWTNAFIREFIATLVSEKKSNIKTLIILTLIVIVVSILVIL